MKKQSIVLLFAILIGASYLAFSEEQLPPGPPGTPVVMCGSYDILGPCDTYGYDPECTCVAYDKCNGGWNGPTLNNHSYHRDDDGWQITFSKLPCTTRYPCIPMGIGGYCDNDDECGRDLNTTTQTKIVQYAYVQPFPQWCGINQN